MLLGQRGNPSTVFRIAISFLLISIVLPWFVRPATTSGVDWLDGVRGLLLGLALGFIYLHFQARRRPDPK